MRDTVYDHENDDLLFEARLGFAMVNHPKAIAALEAKGKARLSFEELARIFGKDPEAKGGGSKLDDVLTKVDFRQAVRSKELGVAAKNSEIDDLFKSFDDDQSGTIDLAELRPCMMALQDAALAAKAQQAAELERSRICEERGAMLLQAEATMRAIDADEERNAQLIAKHPLDVRIGLAMRKSKKALDAIVREWPGAQFGYATREAVGEGLRQLGLRINSITELDDWFDRCFERGLASSICRPAAEGLEAQISLKVELPPLIGLAKREHARTNERAEAVRESKRQALAEQGRIRDHAKAIAKQWALQGAAALRAEADKAAAVELAMQAKRQAAQQRRELERKRKEERRLAAERISGGSTEDGGGGGGAKVYNVQLKSNDIGVRKRGQERGTPRQPVGQASPVPSDRVARRMPPSNRGASRTPQKGAAAAAAAGDATDEDAEVQELKRMIASGPLSKRGSPPGSPEVN